MRSQLVPASFLKPRFAAARSTVPFSATLTPWNFYADMLGLPDDTAWLDVPAPFRHEQLSVRIVSQVSTRHQHRSRSLAPIARIIATQYETAPGNYLAYFSSFDYLEQAASEFSSRHPEVPTWRQGRRMDESEREGFLERFMVDGRGVGFAVLGGSFAEGIDLVGTRLIGAFVATLGLPQFNPVNEELRSRLAGKFGSGYHYTYLFPGIRKVVQAVGRVIRTTSADAIALGEPHHREVSMLRFTASPVATTSSSAATASPTNAQSKTTQSHAGMRESTALAYAKDIRSFVRAGGSIPCDAALVLRYVAAMRQKIAPTTLHRRLMAIAHEHRARGLPSPIDDPSVRPLVRALQLGQAYGQGATAVVQHRPGGRHTGGTSAARSCRSEPTRPLGAPCFRRRGLAVRGRR